MNRRLKTAGKALIMAAVLAIIPCTISHANLSATQLAIGMVDSMAKGDFSSATKNFDSPMSAAMPAERLSQTWAQLTAQVGDFKSRIGTREASEGGYTSVYVTCRFERTDLNIKVVTTATGKVTGLWILPIESPKVEYRIPPYVHKESFEEESVFLNKAGEWQLRGILTVPKGDGPFPAVVLVHGSGPHDEDETIGPNKPFKDLAWGLASRGIAVLRYQKRTKVYGVKIAKMDNLTVKEEAIDDALAGVEVLRQSRKIASGEIFVLGHSLGGTIVPRIGKADPGIAGFIVMAGSARPFEEVIMDQITYIASLSPMTDEKKSEIEKIKKQIAQIRKLGPSTRSSASALILGAPASYWLDLRNYKPAVTARSLKRPILILQGGRDYQVTEADFKIWKDKLSSRTGVTFRFYPDLNHLFMTGTGKATPTEYEKPGTVAESVVADISNWINGKQGYGSTSLAR